MKQKLFENVGGNTFKLLTESISETNPKAKLIREGLKKVFAAGNKSLSYKQLANIGMGYIKDVSEARKCALQESRELASEYGYVEEESSQAFVKQNDHSESDMSNPEESREVQIGKELIELASQNGAGGPSGTGSGTFADKVLALGRELTELHK